MTSFLSNGGSEIGKSLGKDIYDKIKHWFSKEEEKKALHKLETEPFSTIHQENIERLITLKLEDKEFFQDISVSIRFTSSNNFILDRILISMKKIRAQLTELYDYVINSGPDKTGEYHNRINHLESELCRLEVKFWVIIQASAGNTWY